MNILKQLENSPRNLILYTLGLIGGVVDDYTLITLAIFSALLGVVVGSVLIGLTAFFGGYFVLRMVLHLAETIAFHARATLDGHRFVAQATLPQPVGQPVEGDVIP